jgi:hypothetical protein
MPYNDKGKKMYKLYSISKEKTNVSGFWRDENGKVYRDKIHIKSFPTLSAMRETKFSLFYNGENAVFYCKGKKAFIEYSNGKLETLRNCITWQEKKLRPSLVRALLVQHSGLTVYKNENGYTIEIWKE